ncbi:MAG: hypothetical protein HFG68_04255 [Hungatella sp.]|nr:hypothetical protein [Hungatella sp.]
MESKGINTNRETDKDIEIAYQNKDIVSKLFGDRMKGKSLSLFGLKSHLKVLDVRPTNIPIVQVKELRMDNLFELEDGSVAILDYESAYKETNFTKYGRYIMEVIDRYLTEGKQPDIHMMVLYTADIAKVKSIMKRTACSIQIEASYLSGMPSEEWLEDAKSCILKGVINDEVLMHLVILPLTYKGEEKKQKAIKQCVDLAKQIPDKEQETFVLAGILTFTDKIINKETRQYIKEALGMTQVGKMLMEEGRQEGIQKGRQEEATQTTINMLKSGKFSVEEINEFVPRLSLNEIKTIAKKLNL